MWTGALVLCRPPDLITEQLIASAVMRLAPSDFGIPSDLAITRVHPTLRN